jgi:hypothetical protein
MAFTHIINQTTLYNAGGTAKSVTANYNKTGSSEINVSASCTGQQTIADFNLETAANAQSVFFIWEQSTAEQESSIASGYLTDDGGTNVITNLKRGEPYVWQAGDTDKWGANVLQDAMTDLIWNVHAGEAAGGTGTLTARILLNS